jgi:hypothetical protein
MIPNIKFISDSTTSGEVEERVHAIDIVNALNVRAIALKGSLGKDIAAAMRKLGGKDRKTCVAAARK